MGEIRRDYLGTISRAAREVGGLARITVGPPGWRVTVYSVSSPELAAEILRQPNRFRKNGPVIASFVRRWATTCSQRSRELAPAASVPGADLYAAPHRR